MINHANAFRLVPAAIFGSLALMTQVGPSEAEVNLCKWIDVNTEGCLHGLPSIIVWTVFVGGILLSLAWYFLPTLDQIVEQVLWRLTRGAQVELRQAAIEFHESLERTGLGAHLAKQHQGDLLDLWANVLIDLGVVHARRIPFRRHYALSEEERADLRATYGGRALTNCVGGLSTTNAREPIVYRSDLNRAIREHHVKAERVDSRVADALAS